ncbi:hypothetical protein [Xanthovirga aplysinae]|nr:hypothetical protein [Xanthovirga aplysinae]
MKDTLEAQRKAQGLPITKITKIGSSVLVVVEGLVVYTLII